MPIGNAFAILKSVKVKVPIAEIYADDIDAYGIACDSSNNIFYSKNSSSIFKINNDKTSSLFADTSEIPDPKAKPIIRHFSIDSSDNIYTGDTTSGSISVSDPFSVYHFKVKKISPTGTVSTHLTGAGSTTNVFINNDGNIFTSVIYTKQVNRNNSPYMESLNFPTGLAIDSKGDLYVADSLNHVIYKYSANPFGNKIIYAGRSGTSGYLNSTTITDSLFNNPSGICFDKNDNLYIADRFNNSIRKITKSGTISTLIGNTKGNTVGYYKDVKLNGPSDILIGKDECLYIADSGNRCIKKLNFNA